MTGLQPGSNYLGEIVGFNVKGVGVPTIVRVYTLKLPEKLIPPILAEPAPSEYFLNVQTKLQYSAKRWRLGCMTRPGSLWLRGRAHAT